MRMEIAPLKTKFYRAKYMIHVSVDISAGLPDEEVYSFYINNSVTSNNPENLRPPIVKLPEKSQKDHHHQVW